MSFDQAIYIPTKKIGGPRLSPGMRTRGIRGAAVFRTVNSVPKEVALVVHDLPKAINEEIKKSSTSSIDYNASDKVIYYIIRYISGNNNIDPSEIDENEVRKIISNKVRGLFGTISDGMIDSGLTEFNLFDDNCVFSEIIAVALKSRFPVYMNDVSFFLIELAEDFRLHVANNLYQGKKWRVATKGNGLWLLLR